MIKRFEEFNLSESYSVKRKIKNYVLIISNEDKITDLFYFDSEDSGKRSAFIDTVRKIERIFGVDGNFYKSDKEWVWEYKNPTRGNWEYKYGKIILCQCGDEDDYNAYAEEWSNRLIEFQKEYEKDLD